MGANDPMMAIALVARELSLIVLAQSSLIQGSYHRESVMAIVL